MANPNPNPATRFGPGNPSRGRQKAARDKISTAFLEALNQAFHEPNDTGGCKGLDAIKKVRDEDPATFARIFTPYTPTRSHLIFHWQQPRDLLGVPMVTSCRGPA